MKPVEHYETILKARLHKIEHDLDEEPDPDFAERASERENDEVLEEIGATGLAEIKAIRAALKRIEAGTYGICINTGEEIPEARLDAVPHAATIVEKR